jgi:hypothetical protein
MLWGQRSVLTGVSFDKVGHILDAKDGQRTDESEREAYVPPWNGLSCISCPNLASCWWKGVFHDSTYLID